MNDETKFRIVGSIKDKYVATSGKLGKIKIETSINGRRAVSEVKFFDRSVIGQIETCGAGEFVRVEGRLGSESLKDRGGQSVMVDGRQVWMTTLVGDKIESATPSGRAESKKQAPPVPPVDELPDWDHLPE